jgi:hypothetical protein
VRQKYCRKLKNEEIIHFILRQNICENISAFQGSGNISENFREVFSFVRSAQLKAGREKLLTANFLCQFQATIG